MYRFIPLLQKKVLLQNYITLKKRLHPYFLIHFIKDCYSSINKINITFSLKKILAFVFFLLLLYAFILIFAETLKQ